MKKILVLALLALTSTYSYAYTFVVDGIYYNKSGENAIVTYKNLDYKSYYGSVVIPDSVTYEGKSYRVTSIGSHAFQNSISLASVTIPNSVTTL